MSPEAILARSCVTSIEDATEALHTLKAHGWHLVNVERHAEARDDTPVRAAGTMHALRARVFGERQIVTVNRFLPYVHVDRAMNPSAIVRDFEKAAWLELCTKLGVTLGVIS